jgi:hypothetical protein
VSEQRRRYVKLAPDATERECTKCGEVKPLAEFPSRRSGRPSSWCRVCTNGAIRDYSKTPVGSVRKKAAQDSYNARNPDYQVTYRYGLEPGQYDAMRARQDDRCAICRTADAGGKRWHVDHDHVNGRVRGLLCASCNLGIGKMKDDPETLRVAAAYIEQHRDKTTA